MHHTVRYATAAVLVLLVHTAAATAGTGSRSSTLLTAGSESLAGPPGTPLTLALAEIPAPASVEATPICYRPRSSPPASSAEPHHASTRDNDITSASQVHAGYFTPEGGLGTRFDLGVRGGPVIGHAFQVGIAADWLYRTENISRPITSSVGPGGVPITTTQTLANATVNMFPVMAFAQLNLLDFLGLKPYIGGAAGYQVMLLSGQDFASGDSFDATFGGWGWQWWAGAGLPLSHHARLIGEAFVNDVDMARDITDPNTGDTVHETVNGGGKGLRFGLAWGF